MTPCPERDRLLAEHLETTRAYADAVGNLRHDDPEPDYRRLYEATETARLRSEQRRILYEAHLNEHGC